MVRVGAMSGVSPGVDHLQSPRLSDVLFDQNSLTFGNLVPLRFNVEAIEAALVFSAGLTHFIAIIGPSGWGKSHILHAIQNRFRAEGREAYPAMSASKAVGDHSNLTFSSPLLLDDCQESVDGGRSRSMLRLTLETRVRTQRPTILSFTGSKVTRQIRSLLPHPREWTVCVIDTPQPHERTLLIERMAEADGLVLSSALVKILAHEMYGNGRTIAGALKRLRLFGSNWEDNLLTVRACGILNAFFSDNSSWDLKHRILRLIYDPRRNVDLGKQFPDLAAYIMLKVASLGEAEVARSLNVESAEAYFSASRFEIELGSNPSNMSILMKLVDDLVRILSKE
jgi:chromosomal replication initiation ATPase DnaA